MALLLLQILFLLLNSGIGTADDNANTDSIRGYDCFQPTKISSVSLINVEDCNIKPENTTLSKVKIRLLQRQDYDRVKFYQCKIIVKRDIYNCSDLDKVLPNKHAEYMYTINREDCIKLHKGQAIPFYDNIVLTGKVNASNTIQSTTYVGNYSSDECIGKAFKDPFCDYPQDIAAVGDITVALQSFTLLIYLKSEKVNLPSGLECNFQDGHCTDTFDGQTFWDTLSMSSVECSNLGILADAEVDKIVGEKKTIYSIEAPDITFALAITKTTNLCKTTIYETEHPQLLIWEYEKGVSVGKKITIIENFDIIQYINAKFVYFDYHIKRQLSLLYYDILEKECELEKKILENLLLTATISPDEFVLKLKKKRGYSGILAGEVIHVVECIPVEVLLRRTEKCYMELPIIYNGTKMYLNPITHIIKSFGTEVRCTVELATMFHLNNRWYGFNPKALVLRGGGPKILQPEINANWSYDRPNYLASSGIYTTEQLDILRRRIIDGQDKHPIQTSLIQGFHQGEAYISPFDFSKLVEGHLLDFLFSPLKYWWHYVLHYLNIIGNFIAAIYGFFICFLIVKLVIILCINVYKKRNSWGILKQMETLIFFKFILNNPSQQETTKQNIRPRRSRTTSVNKTKNIQLKQLPSSSTRKTENRQTNETERKKKRMDDTQNTQMSSTRKTKTNETQCKKSNETRGVNSKEIENADLSQPRKKKNNETQNKQLNNQKVQNRTKK